MLGKRPWLPWQRSTNVAEIGVGRPLFVARRNLIVTRVVRAVPVTDRSEHAFQYGSRTHQFSAETTTPIGDSAATPSISVYSSCFNDHTSGEFGHCRRLAVLLRTLLDGNVSGVGGGDEAGLREGVFQGEELVFRDRRRPRLEHGPGADRRQVLTLHVSERDVTPVVLDRKVAVLESNEI